MGKPSKLSNVEFAVADFATQYRPEFIIHVRQVIKKYAHEAMLKGDQEILLTAIRNIKFHEGAARTTYPFSMAADLAEVAKLLWLRNAPNPTLIESFAQRKGLSRSKAKRELARICTGNFSIHFTHAWRLLDGEAMEKIFLEARKGLISEVVAQTLSETPGRDALPVTRKQLYQFAVWDEEQLRKQRMGIRRGGSESSNYNFRWFPQQYVKAYTMLKGSAEVSPKQMRSRDKRKRQEWMREVKNRYPDLEEELIARLTRHEADLTEDHLHKLTLKGGDSTPHQIALEQAARWCGVKRYLYTQRGLEKRLESFSKQNSPSHSSALPTLLGNWYGKGQKLTKEEIRAITKMIKANF